MKDFALNLIEQANDEKLINGSFKHWHAKGVNYICLSRSDDVTAKLYIFRPGEVILNHDGYVVNPHTHRYNFSTWILNGEVNNISFEKQLIGKGNFHEFEYFTPLDNQNIIHNYVGETNLVSNSEKYVNKPFFPTEYYLKTSDIHSISIDPKEYTVLFLLQYKDLLKSTNLYMKDKELPIYDGLYEKYKLKEIKYLLDELKGNLK